MITTAEHHIDQYIITQVQSLLGSRDQASSNGLQELDNKLDEEIRKMRTKNTDAKMAKTMDAERDAAKSDFLN